MRTSLSFFARGVAACFVVVAAGGPADAVVTNVPVSSSNAADWQRSDGGSGTTMPQGGPSVWNAAFQVAIPPGATAISLTLDSFSADDKGVVELNAGIIADHVIFNANGSAGGAGVFDFGDGAGSVSYTFAGWTPGTVFPLPDGITDPMLIVYINDTSTTNPMATPIPTTFISSFSLAGTLSFDAPGTETPTPTPTLTSTGTSTPTVTATTSNTPSVTLTTTPSPSSTSTPTRTNTPTLTTGRGDEAPSIPTVSGVGALLFTLVLAGAAVFVLTRSRA
jgi:hypothetical protein